jgi:hypothetical protein
MSTAEQCTVYCNGQMLVSSSGEILIVVINYDVGCIRGLLGNLAIDNC